MCPRCPLAQRRRKNVVKRGFFPRKTARSPWIQRYHCKVCRLNFSAQTTSPTYRERKSHLNAKIFRLLCMGVSQREIARCLAIRQRTVANKCVRLARHARRLREKKIKAQTHVEKIDTVVFDEMETFEHTKLKPLSIAVAVCEKSRRIIAVEVAQMPAKGRLAAKSRKKYGPRADHRPTALRQALAAATLAGGSSVLLKSDESPRYPKYVREMLPGATHLRFKGRRGCVVGQGELKATGFDPLFALNHTCAATRDRLKRLTRRTWCTSKRADRLQSLLDLVAYFHNERLKTPQRRVGLPMTNKHN